MTSSGGTEAVKSCAKQHLCWVKSGAKTGWSSEVHLGISEIQPHSGSAGKHNYSGLYLAAVWNGSNGGGVVWAFLQATWVCVFLEHQIETGLNWILWCLVFTACACWFIAISGMRVQQSHPWLHYRPMGSESCTLSEINNCFCKYSCGFRGQSIPFSPVLCTKLVSFFRPALSGWICEFWQMTLLVHGLHTR